MKDMELGKEHMDKIHEIIEGKGKDESVREKEESRAKEDSLGIDKKRKGKAEKKKSSYSAEVIKMAVHKLK